MMTNERRKRAGVQLCYPFEEKRLAKWEPPYIVQPKLDGERCRAVWHDTHGYLLISSTERIIESVPHINAALNKTGLRAELDGELYRHGSTFEEISSVVSRTVNLHPEHQAIEFHIFDVVNEEATQLNRAMWLADNFVPTEKLAFVETQVAESLEEIMNHYVQFLNKAYEGIVVRHINAPYLRRRSTWVMKFKPKKDDWYKVFGYSLEKDKHGNPKPGRLGRIIMADGDMPFLYEYPYDKKLPEGYFSAGSGLTDDQRARYWAERDRLPGSLCHVQYQHITPGKQVPRFPVFVEVE